MMFGLAALTSLLSGVSAYSSLHPAVRLAVGVLLALSAVLLTGWGGAHRLGVRIARCAVAVLVLETAWWLGVTRPLFGLVVRSLGSNAPTTVGAVGVGLMGVLLLRDYSRRARGLGVATASAGAVLLATVVGGLLAGTAGMAGVTAQSILLDHIPASSSACLILLAGTLIDGVAWMLGRGRPAGRSGVST